MSGESVTGPGYHAAREHAAVLDRGARVRIEFTGPQAHATLNGLVTNDVAVLRPGDGLYAAALTAKGKVIADVRVFARVDSLLVDTDARAAPGLLEMLRKFVNPRFAKFRDVSAEMCSVGVFGPDAAKLAGAASGASADALAALAPFAHVAANAAGTGAFILRTPEFGLDGFEVVAPVTNADALLSALRQHGAAALDDSSADVLRIEAGRPRYGVDFDGTQLAQEVGFDRLGAISFSKGCYTGQETVARVHFRGHVNRSLRGLRANATIPAGAQLRGTGTDPVGDVRSVAHSPVHGHIGLAYVRREVADGAAVTAVGATGEVPATVVALPFG